MFQTINEASYNIIAPKLNSSQYDALKIVALISMVICHIGIVFYEGNMIFYSIGRLAMPIFTFLMVYSYIYHTKSPLKYLIRLLVVGILAQAPYLAVFDLSNVIMKLNIMFTLAFGLIIIYVLDYAQKQGKETIKYLAHYLMLIFFVIAGSFVDYIHLGLLLVFSYWLWLRNPSVKTMNFAIAMTALLNAPSGFIVAGVGLLSLVVIVFFTVYTPKIKRVSKWYFYLFYPLHFVVLHIIKII